MRPNKKLHQLLGSLKKRVNALTFLKDITGVMNVSDMYSQAENLKEKNDD